jgi:hypothetical protein
MGASGMRNFSGEGFSRSIVALGKLAKMRVFGKKAEELVSRWMTCLAEKLEDFSGQELLDSVVALVKVKVQAGMMNPLSGGPIKI